MCIMNLNAFENFTYYDMNDLHFKRNKLINK